MPLFVFRVLFRERIDLRRTHGLGDVRPICPSWAFCPPRGVTSPIVPGFPREEPSRFAPCRSGHLLSFRIYLMLRPTVLAVRRC